MRQALAAAIARCSYCASRRRGAYAPPQLLTPHLPLVRVPVSGRPARMRGERFARERLLARGSPVVAAEVRVRGQLIGHL